KWEIGGEGSSRYGSTAQNSEGVSPCTSAPDSPSTRKDSAKQSICRTPGNLPWTGASPHGGAVKALRRRWIWMQRPWRIVVTDRFGTGTGYHGSSEGHLKTTVPTPKCPPLLYLGQGPEEGEELEKGLHRKIGNNSASGRLQVIEMEQVKVTPRDRQVLNLLVQGCSNKEIAGQLQISPRTVKQHLRTLFLRAGIREGRKRVKLAIAMFNRSEARSRPRASA